MTEKEKKARINAYRKEEQEKYRELCEHREPNSEEDVEKINVNFFECVKQSPEKEIEVLKDGKYKPEQENILQIDIEEHEIEDTSR